MTDSSRPPRELIGQTGEAFAEQVHFVSGKGGVGKSVVACALADRFARLGHKTLLCQINATDSHSALLGTPVPGPDVTLARPNLYVVNIEPRAALKEYALMVLRFERVYRAVFENRVTQAFLRFLPALAELNMLGKIWFHATERDGDKPEWDRIVVDAPSTGHGLSLLRVARVMEDITRGKGPMAQKARDMRETLEDGSIARLHVVTLPEELPVNETIDLVSAAREENGTQLGVIIANRVTRPLCTLPRDVETYLRPLPDGERDGLSMLYKNRKQREDDEQVLLERLVEAKTGLPLLTIFDVGTALDKALVSQLGDALVSDGQA